MLCVERDKHMRREMLFVRERCGERDKHMRREILCVRERRGDER